MAKIRNESERLVTYQPLPSGGRRKRIWVREEDGRVLYQDSHDYHRHGDEWDLTWRHGDYSWHVWGERTEHDNGEVLTITVKPTHMTLPELRAMLASLGWRDW